MPATMLRKKTVHISRNLPERMHWRAVRVSPAARDAADAADDAVDCVEQGQVLYLQGIGGQEVAKAEEEAAGHGEPARAEARQVDAAPGGGEAEAEDGDAERPGGLGVRPAADSHDGLLEVAPGVDRAEGKLQQRAHAGDQPAVRGVCGCCQGGFSFGVIGHRGDEGWPLSPAYLTKIAFFIFG